MSRIAAIESERLRLTHYVASDLGELFAIHADPLTGRYTYFPGDPAEAAERYEAAEAMRECFGAGPWVARDAVGDVVGYGGLLIDNADPGWGVEIAYFIAPARWGCGFATEIAAAGVRFGFETLKLDRIVSFAHPENAASNRVLEKVGFRLAEFLPGMNRNRYQLTSDGFRSIRP